MRKGIISALLVISCSAPIDYFGNEVNIKSDRIYLIKMRKDKSNKDMYTLVFVEQRGNPTKSSLKKRKVTLSIKLLEELQNKEAVTKFSSPLSGKNLPFSSLSDKLDKKEDKKKKE